jgi:TRAP-type mannitol/chloroaromatic compound transport system permease small subunit
LSVAALERAAAAWTRRLALLAGWVLLGLSVVTVFDALGRKLFSRPIQGTFEASELLLGVVIFFALPYTGLTDGHVVLDLATNRLGRRAQAVIVGLNALFVALFLAFVASELAVLADTYGRTGRTTITMRIPVYPFAVAIMLAGWLAAAASVVQALGCFARAAWPDATDA